MTLSQKQRTVLAISAVAGAGALVPIILYVHDLLYPEPEPPTFEELYKTGECQRLRMDIERDRLVFDSANTSETDIVNYNFECEEITGRIE